MDVGGGHVTAGPAAVETALTVGTTLAFTLDRLFLTANLEAIILVRASAPPDCSGVKSNLGTVGCSNIKRRGGRQHLQSNASSWGIHINLDCSMRWHIRNWDLL